MSDKKQVEIIGVLRAVAALMVCCYHFIWHRDPSGNLFPDGHFIKDIGWQGQLGVYVFFVISGFVIPLSMYYGRYEIHNFFSFMGKRLARLHPPFIFSMLLYGILEIGYCVVDGKPLFINWSKIFHNFFLTAKFGGESWIQDVFWTLSIEFQYYIVIGLLYPLMMKFKDMGWFLFIVLFTLSSELFWHDQKHYLFFHAPVFSMGILLFLHHIKKIGDIEFLIMTGWCMIEANYEMGPEINLSAVITVFAIAVMNWRSKITDLLGDASYSIYLFHGFSGAQFLYYTNPHTDTIAEKVAILIAAVALTIGFSLMCERWVERPSVRWSQKIKYKRKSATPAA